MNKIDRMRELVCMLNKHTELYDMGTPEISDKEWDDMYFELVDLEHECDHAMPDSPTQKVNYTVVNELQKVKHNHPMLSLDKTKDWHEFLRYFTNQSPTKGVVGMLKLDGLTCSLRYIDGGLVSAETRGDGVEGEDILHNALVIKNIPKRIDYPYELVVDGEIICDYDTFQEFKDEYANPRNFAAGSVRLLDSKECARRRLKFVLWNVVVGPYETVIENFDAMDRLGFTVTPWTSSFDLDAKDFLVEEAAIAHYPIDGLVGRFNDQVFGEYLGATGHHSRAAYAFKFYDELYETKLLDIEWTMGKTNTLNPTAVFQTVNIDGTDVSKASLHNVSILKKLGLTNNCTIQVYKANQIIPQINSCIQDGDSAIEIPKYCPICGGRTEIIKENDSEVLICTNPNCSGKLLGRMKFFVSKHAANIDGLSEKTLETLISLGLLHEYKDIYHLSDHRSELILLDGFGQKSIDNLLCAIEKSRDIKLENFLNALGIPDVGLSTAKTMAARFDGYRGFMSRAVVFDWKELDGIGSVTAEKISKFLTENMDTIRDLASEFNFIENDDMVIEATPFNGKNVAVTGKLIHFTRDSINAKIESLGAKPVSGVTSKTHYLINNDPASSSSKNKKANELNIPIITEIEFLQMIGGDTV